ncbi:MAG: NUDIX hydrolase [Candidatus Binatia bacterium]
MSEITRITKASTVILVRAHENGGPEVLMTRRPQEMKTLGGFLVFPGGAVEKEDWSDAMMARCRGLLASEAQKLLGAQIPPEMALGHWVAAARELFEETGIYLFVNGTGSFPGPKQLGSTKRLAVKRKTLADGRLTFPQLLASEKLFCDLGRLGYLFHRVTPEKYPVRFDTRFYVAALPADQKPLAASEEVAESLWISPEAALERSERGQFPMMPPTIIALRTLADHGSWDNLRSAYHLV